MYGLWHSVVFGKETGTMFFFRWEILKNHTIDIAAYCSFNQFESASILVTV